MHILITGGAGFVGSHVALDLRKREPKAKIIALDNLKRRGSELNLNRLQQQGIQFVHGDIRNPEDLEVLKNVDLLIECSAEPSVMAGYSSAPAYTVNTNLVGTLHCLEFARKSKATVIFLSTSRVYPYKAVNSLKFSEAATRFELGQESQGASVRGVSEDFPMQGPRSLYGATKFASEIMLQEYFEMYGVRGVINRCSVIAGPWQMGKVDQGFVVFWAARHLFNQPVQYFGFKGSGKQVRDVLHIEDLCRLIYEQVSHPERFQGEVFNVGGGVERSVSLLELTKICERFSGRQVPHKGVPEDRPADVQWFIADSSKVKKRCGWTPRKTLEETVEEVYRWLAAHQTELEPILNEAPQ